MTELIWQELVSEISQLYCHVHRISQCSPLFMSTVAAAYSLPQYITAHKALDGGKQLADKVSTLNQREMATEVNLGPDFTFHNIFMCPVSKETSGLGNNPMLLKCGHVISKHSLNKMTRGNTQQIFKCPTCPMEMTQTNGVENIVL